MPAVSKKQQRLFGAAEAAKSGKKTFPAAEKLAARLPKKTLDEFAKGPVVPKAKKKGGK